MTVTQTGSAGVQLPYFRRPVFCDDQMARMGHQQARLLGKLEAELLHEVWCSRITLGAMAARLTGPGSSLDAVTRSLEQRFADAGNAIGCVEIPVSRQPYDIVIVDQGYGGVYVHTVELARQLRTRWRVLLLAPVDPLFASDRHPDDVTLPALERLLGQAVQYHSYVHILRGLLNALVPPRLLLITHRSQSLYLFDLIGRQRTVIYCDGYYDGGFRLARECGFQRSPGLDDDILSELYYQLGNSGSYCAPFGSPSTCAELLAAGYFSLVQAHQNWCWGRLQTENFEASFPELKGRILFEPPFTDPAMFASDRVHRERTILFTTTMHNIDKKGLPELVRALHCCPEVLVDCIVRQPERLPPIADTVRARLRVRALKKEEMVHLYHRVWLNCRVSREESSPLSILESMICEVPQIVSPAVAEQIPLLEHGITGFIVDPDDTQGLARALREILGDASMRDEMGRACRLRAEGYSFAARVRTFDELLS
jgi:glycosyltransferase involved in cell wall biosynthesis